MVVFFHSSMLLLLLLLLGGEIEDDFTVAKNGDASFEGGRVFVKTIACQAMSLWCSNSTQHNVWDGSQKINIGEEKTPEDPKQISLVFRLFLGGRYRTDTTKFSPVGVYQH